MRSQTFVKSRLPDTPGVYFFKKGRDILYIGKATSLRDRVRSYFSRDLVETRGMLLVDMVAKASAIDFVKTDSVVEALLLEAELIRKHRPYYNTKEKDDKSYNCVVITKEDFPRVLVVRQHDLKEGGIQESRFKIQEWYGPYPNGTQLRDALKIIRRIFPFRDAKCTPPLGILPFLKGARPNRYGRVPHSDERRDFKSPALSESGTPFTKGGIKMLGRPCFNRQIGLCPGVCTGEISKQEYGKILSHLALFFRGKKKVLISKLEREMHAHAKRQEFEKAVAIRKTIFALNHIQDVALIKATADRRGWDAELRGGGKRVEGYDIAHMAGKETVGVMIAIENGVADKTSYRKFKIRGGKGNDDIHNLEEVMRRRFAHPEWKFPNLVIVDGGAAQRRAAEIVLREFWLTVPVIAVVKNAAHKPDHLLGPAELIKIHEREILLANAEAHRFALAYHRSRRARNFIH